MNVKRSNIEIIADILKVARMGAKKSHIVYKANLNFKIAKQYLDQLIKNDLINGPEGRNRLFTTTTEGTKYINHYETVQRYINPQ